MIKYLTLEEILKMHAIFIKSVRLSLVYYTKKNNLSA
ncbi:hypothetical protein PARA125_000739 [Parachlamydia sp. AcF125]|nr:hypothetical protein [Parachlamydia sp. AcF125]